MLKGYGGVKRLDNFHLISHFQRMLKSSLRMKTSLNESMRGLEADAANVLRALLEQVPALRLEDLKVQPEGPDRGIDILAKVRVGGRAHTLVCEVKASGQPRHIRMAVLQLHNQLDHLGENATPIVIAPYLSPEVQALCREEQIGFLDLEGNARLVFDSVFIERVGQGKRVIERRELKSLFKPKSAQVLRVMLREPRRAWRVAELAEAAHVSLGHVSNVRTGLLDREWGQVSPEGLLLSDPDGLLDSWRDAYHVSSAHQLRFYTTLHGAAFDEAARLALTADPASQASSAQSRRHHAALASFSAARWLAPYGRVSTHFFYADEDGVARLQDWLSLSPVGKGENIVVTIPREEGIFLDAIEPAPGLVCTSPVQTYLDLAVAGERGRESADHLREEQLNWQK